MAEITMCTLYEDNGGGLHWVRGGRQICHMMGGWDKGQGLRDIVDLTLGDPQGDWKWESLQEGDLDGEIKPVLDAQRNRRGRLTVRWIGDYVSEVRLAGGHAAKDYMIYVP